MVELLREKLATSTRDPGLFTSLILGFNRLDLLLLCKTMRQKDSSHRQSSPPATTPTPNLPLGPELTQRAVQKPITNVNHFLCARPLPMPFAPKKLFGLRSWSVHPCQGCQG